MSDASASGAAAQTRLRCLERAAALEDAEGAIEALLLIREQLVRPVDCGAEGLLARIAVAPRAEQVETVAEPLEQLIGRVHRRPRGRELERER